MDNHNTKPYAYLNGYDVRKTPKGKIWTRVATAWPHHKDKGGFTVELNAIPLTGTIVFLPPDPKGKNKPSTKAKK